MSATNTKELNFTDYKIPPAEESIERCISQGLILRLETGELKAVERPKAETPVECHKKPSFYRPILTKEQIREA